MHRPNEVHAFMLAASIHAGVGIACFAAFGQTITQQTVVVVDQASIHTSAAWADRIPYWQQRGLVSKYLRPYSPALHLMRRHRWPSCHFKISCRTRCRLTSSPTCYPPMSGKQPVPSCNVGLPRSVAISQHALPAM